MLHLPCHMIATLFQLDHSLAAVAPLPSLLLRHLHQAVRLLIFRTFPLRVEFTVAKYTDLCLAVATSCVFSAGSRIHLYPRRFDPLATCSGGTVQAVGSRVLLVFPIPQDFEFVVEKSIGVLQRDVLRGATSGRHMLWVLYRQGELTLQT
jgi:hypothetical protein